MTHPVASPIQRPADPRALRILAKSIYRELKTAGYDRSDIVALTNELLDMLSTEMRDSEIS